MAGKRTTLTYPREYYYVEAYESGILTPKEARKEYNRLRKVAQQRLKTLEKSRFSEWNIYQKNKVAFALPGGKISDRKIGKALYDVMRFVTAKSSTITGLKEIEAKSLETLRKHGADFLNEQNVASFGEFMKRARYLTALNKKDFDSERSLELFEAARKKDIDPAALTKTKKGFELWLKGVDKLNKMEEYNSKEGSAVYYRTKLKRLDKAGML